MMKGKTYLSSLGVPGLILAVTAIFLANSGWNSMGYKFIIVLTGAILISIIIIFLQRPKGSRSGLSISQLRQRTSLRDWAFLVEAEYPNFPKTISKRTISHSPPLEVWNKEGTEKSEVRAERLLALKLLERNGSEVRTTDLGNELLAHLRSKQLIA